MDLYDLMKSMNIRNYGGTPGVIEGLVGETSRLPQDIKVALIADAANLDARQ
jgi:hypothetical protein